MCMCRNTDSDTAFSHRLELSGHDSHSKPILQDTLQNGRRRRGWMPDGQRQRLDVPAHARSVHDCSLQGKNCSGSQMNFASCSPNDPIGQGIGLNSTTCLQNCAEYFLWQVVMQNCRKWYESVQLGVIVNTSAVLISQINFDSTFLQQTWLWYNPWPNAAGVYVLRRANIFVYSSYYLRKTLWLDLKQKQTNIQTNLKK